jgi:hypothetical protein
MTIHQGVSDLTLAKGNTGLTSILFPEMWKKEMSWQLVVDLLA